LIRRKKVLIKIRNKFMQTNDKPAEFKKDNIEFHVKSQDYFGTLATILSLNLEMLHEKINDSSLEETDRLIKGIITNLMYLQDNYKIEKK